MQDTDLDNHIRRALRSREVSIPSGATVVRQRDAHGLGLAMTLLVAALAVAVISLALRGVPAPGPRTPNGVGGFTAGGEPSARPATSTDEGNRASENIDYVHILSVTPAPGTIISGQVEFRVVLDYQVDLPGSSVSVEFISDSNGPSLGFTDPPYTGLDPARHELTMTFTADAASLDAVLGRSVYLQAYVVSERYWTAWEERPDLGYTVSP